MDKMNRPIPVHLRRILTKTRPEKKPLLKKPGQLANNLFEAPKGYKFAGSMTVENFQLVEDTVKPHVYYRAGKSDDIIIKLRSETITKDGRMVKDRIVAEYFERDPAQIPCV